MSSDRDNFTKSTIEIIAKRVGYLCSNPTCRRPTVGANEELDKSTSIGVAAHITAASPGGPRYDDTLEREQRRHVENGIWLCAICATLVDKDEKKFTAELLRIWKENAENESRAKLVGIMKVQPTGNPYLEVDLIWKSAARLNRGYSMKNPITSYYDGKPVRDVTDNPVIHWMLVWNFSLTIYNNSNFPAYNLSIRSIGGIQFTQFDSLDKVNNLPPFQNIDLRAKYEDFIEGPHGIADKILKSRIPQKFNDLCLILSYLDESRSIHQTQVNFTNTDIINTRP